MSNRFKDEQKSKPKVKASAVKGKISAFITGKILIQNDVLKNAPFFIFLFAIALIYIGNGYYAEDTVRRAQSLENELKELRSEYIYTKSELMFSSKQSEVAQVVAAIGLKESVVPPKKIVIND
jgi:hypothetical protein